MSRPLKNWSDDEIREFAKQYCLHGEDYAIIADQLGKSPSAMSRAAKQIGIRGHKGDVQQYIDMYGDDVSPVLRPVRHKTPTPPGVRKGETSFTSLHWGDLQIPFQDERAVNILYQITDDLKPDQLYASGDIIDFWQISNHRPPDERKLKPEEINLQKHVDQTAEHAAIMLQLAQPDYAEWRDGNHEDRFDRLLLEMQQNPKMRHLLHLTRVREALDLHYVLGIKEQGWNIKGYENEPTVLKDKLVLIHGNKTTKWYTRSLLNSFGTSVLAFHAHRFQSFTKRDLRGQEAGFGVGCLCRLDPHYQQMPNWNQGFAVVDWSKIGGEWYFDVDFVRIHEGKAIFRGNYYEAN